MPILIGWEQLNPVVLYANRLVSRPDYRFGPRVIRDHQLIWVADGLGRADIQGRDYEAKSGDLFYYGPNVTHTFVADGKKPFVLYGLHFALVGAIPGAGQLAPGIVIENAEGIRERVNELTIGRAPDAFAVPERFRIPSGIAERCFAAVAQSFGNATPAGHLLNRTLLTRFLLEFRELVRQHSESDTVQGRLLREVRTRLQHQAALPYDRAWLREWTHYHENYAATLFLRQYGVSPHDYFLECKLELARERIAAGAMSVGAIAELLHFGSVHHFSRLFKAKTGYSPLVYRRLSGLI